MGWKELARGLSLRYRVASSILRRDWRGASKPLKRSFACAAILAVHSLLFISPAGQQLERFMLHRWFALRGPRPIPQGIVLVRLDGPAYAKVNLLPGERFPRAALAQGINRMKEAGAKLIVLDLVPIRESNSSEADELLAKALADSPSVIGRYNEILEDTDVSGKKRRQKLLNKPHAMFADAAKAVIQTEIRGEQDGSAERICLSNDITVLSDTRVPLLEPLRRFVFPDIREPGGSDYINYYGGPSSLASMSFADLLGDGSKLTPEVFKDRVVFVGVMLPAGTGIAAGKDTSPTSFSREQMYGVEIHATIAANLLDGSWVRQVDPVKAVVGIGLIAFVTTFVVCSIPVWYGCVVILAVVGTWLAISFYVFSHAFYFVPGACLTVTLIVALMVPLVIVESFLGAERRLWLQVKGAGNISSR